MYLILSIKYWFSPFCLNEDIGLKRLLNGVDVTDFDEHHSNEHFLLLTAKPKLRSLIINE